MRRQILNNNENLYSPYTSTHYICIAIESLALESLRHAAETHERRLSFSSLSLPTLRTLICFAFLSSSKPSVPRFVASHLPAAGLGMDPRHERSRPFRAIGLDVIRTCKLAASYDVIKVYGPRRLQLRMSSCLAQPRALPPKGVGRRGVSACFTLQRSVAPSLTSYLSYLPSTPISLLDAVHLTPKLLLTSSV